MYNSCWLDFEDGFSCWYYKVDDVKLADLEKEHGMLLCAEPMDLGEEEEEDYYPRKPIDKIKKL